MKSFIHPTAIVSPEAIIGENVHIGAYTIVGDHVKIGKNCKIHSHVVLDGHLTMGENNEIYPFSSIGAPPQDLSYKGEETYVIIGNNNVFREYVSIHRGTLKENKKTVVGSDCLLMAHVHLGHDVVLGNRCIFANSVNLAGHVKVADFTIIGGGTNVSQFVQLGKGSYIGGATAVDRDIPLFCTAYGNRVRLKGINIIGLRRQGFEKILISEVVDFYRNMESSALSPKSYIEQESVKAEYKDNPIVKEMMKMIGESQIGIAPFMS